MKDKFLWNARENGSVRASRIRNFTIEENQNTFLVIAWINDEESVKMGIFEEETEAVKFLDHLHRQCEEVNA